ncbi:MAG: D-alanyl-D-alanine carboxypeptidase/D-alanyl-D-alanine-endopeptidase, partial [Bacteroidia bacterium]
KTGPVGEKAKVNSIVPEIPGLNILSEVKAGGSDDNAYIYGAPFQENRKVLGTVPANQSNYEVEGSMPDPAFYCAYAFSNALRRAGIEVKGKAQSTYTAAEKGKTIYSHRSPSLEKIVYHTNLRSNNHYAETLLKTIALKKNGYGTTSGGCDAVLNYWKSRGVETDGLFMNDGSGLSRSNGISTYQQALVLAKIYRDSTIYRSFNASLPVSGVSGSLANLCKGTFCEKNMRAKSGYITRARGYCGYVKTKKGEELCFSVLFNNYNCSPAEVKGKMEKLLGLLVDL